MHDFLWTWLSPAGIILFFLCIDMYQCWRGKISFTRKALLLWLAAAFCPIFNVVLITFYVCFVVFEVFKEIPNALEKGLNWISDKLNLNKELF